MIATGAEILNYIPQRPPIVMVDTLIEASEKKLVSAFTVPANNIFVDNGCLCESGIVEHIAQTAAAGIGYKQVNAGLAVNLGYIAAIKNLKIMDLPVVNSRLTTSIEVVNEVMEVTIVNAQVTCNNQPVAHCEMRIFTKS